MCLESEIPDLRAKVRVGAAASARTIVGKPQAISGASPLCNSLRPREKRLPGGPQSERWRSTPVYRGQSPKLAVAHSIASDTERDDGFTRLRSCAPPTRCVDSRTHSAAPSSRGPRVWRSTSAIARGGPLSGLRGPQPSAAEYRGVTKRDRRTWRGSRRGRRPEVRAVCLVALRE